MLIRDILITVKRYMHLCIREVFSQIQEYYFAKRYGLAFISGIHDDKVLPGMHHDAKGYEASRYTHLRKALDYLDITPDDVFVDFGCGKGRVLAFAAIKRPRRVVGVELVEKYAEIARANAHTLTRRLKIPVEVRTEDAAFCSIEDGTIYYLFNPFGTSTLQSVLDNIRKSLETNPRRVRIAYYNPSHEVLLGRIEWLEKVHQIQSQSLVAGTISISIWQNKLLPGRDREASVRSSESLFPQ